MASPIHPKLNDEQKVFVVHALACFDSPATVRDALKAEFGVQVSAQAMECYDPTKRAGRALSGKLRALFEAARKKFLEDTSTIGVANRAMRLRMIGRIAERAENQGNTAVALQALEQAAKECGDAYTNRRELTGKDGAPLPIPAPVTVFALPDNGRG